VIKFFGDAFVETALDHIDSDSDGIGKAESICPAVAFDNDPIQAKKHGAIVPARIDLDTHHIDGAVRKQIPQPGEQRAPKCVAYEGRVHLGDTLGGLKRNIARETIRDHHIHGPGPNGIALDKTVKFNREINFPQRRRGLAQRLVTFEVFLTYI
jgi:hypothetical protein